MSERSSTKIAAASVPTLSPQGVLAGKPAMSLGRPFTLVGARNRAHLHLISSSISRNHACIIVTDNGLYVRDLASRTGVTVNGRRAKEADLRDGNSLQVGSFQFKFNDPAGPVRFPLTPKAAPAMLEVGSSTQTPLNTRTLLIGRRSTADIPLNETSVSNTHALIFEVDGHHFIRDLGSRTGTIVNGKPVHHQLLEFGDEIKIGETVFHYISAGATAVPATVPVEEPELLEPELAEEEPIGLEFSEPETPSLALPKEQLKDEEPLVIPLEREEERLEFPLGDEEEPETIPPSAPPPRPEVPAPAPVASVRHIAGPLEALEPADDIELDFELMEPTPKAKPQPSEPIEKPIAIDFATPPPPAATADAAPELKKTPDLEPILVENVEADANITESLPAADAEGEAPIPPPEAPIEIVQEELPPSPAEQTEVSIPLESATAEAAEHELEAVEAAGTQVPHQEEPLEIGPMSPGEDNELTAPIDSIETPVAEPELTAEAPETESPAPQSESQEYEHLPSFSVPNEYEFVLTGEPTPPSEPAEIEPTASSINSESIPVEPVPQPVQESTELSPENEAYSAAEAATEEAKPVGGLAEQQPAIPEAEKPQQEESRSTEPPPDETASSESTKGKRKARGGAKAPGKSARGSRKKNTDEVSPQIESEPTPGDSPRRRSSRRKSPPAEPQAGIDVGPSADLTAIAPPNMEATPPLDSAMEDQSFPLVIPTAVAEPSELLEPTEPTPESALDLDQALEVVPAPQTEEKFLTANPADATLTDTAFDQDVRDFSGSGLGPLVEAPVEAPPPANAAERHQPLETETLADAVQNEAPPAQTPAEVHEPDIQIAESPESAPQQRSDDVDFDLPDLDLDIDLAETPQEHGLGLEAKGRQNFDLEADLSPAPVEAATDQIKAEAVPGEESLPIDESLSSTETIAPSRQPPAGPQEPVALDVPLSAQEPIVSPPNSAPAPSQSVSAPVPPPRPALDPFFGMSRDLASFIGGMPLTLTSTQALPPAPTVRPAAQAAPPKTPAAQQAAPIPAPAPPTEPSTLSFSEDAADSIPPLDLSLPDEPLDLFDQTPERLDEIPDEIGRVNDVTETLASRPPVAAPLPPTPAPQAAPPPPPKPTLRQVAPPPPPKSSPLRSFTTGPQAAPPPPQFPPNISVTPPPFGGVPQQQRITAPQVRQVDVFSNISFPPLDPSMFGAPQRPKVPPALRPSPLLPQPQHSVPAAQPRPAPAAKREAALPVQPAPVVTATTVMTPSTVAESAPPPTRRRWWKSLRFLLPLMILAILVVIVVVMFFPPRHIVQGSLQLQGIEDKQGMAAHQQVVRLRKLIASPHVRQVATGSLQQQNLDPGFISDPEAMDALSDPRNSPFVEARSQLVLNRSTRDDSDKARLKSLLDAVYAESGAGNDQAAQDRGQLAQKQAELNDLQNQETARLASVKQLAQQITASAGPAAQALLVNPLVALPQVEQSQAQLAQSLSDAASKVAATRQSLNEAQAKALQADPQRSAQFQGIAQTVKDWSARLDAVISDQHARADAAAANVSGALNNFDSQLASFPAGGLNSSGESYLTSARETTSQLRQLNSAMTVRRKLDAEVILQLRRQILDRRAAHLRQLWAGDPSLQQFSEERKSQSSAPVVENLDRKIDARRDALSIGDQDADPLQRDLQQAIDRIALDQQVYQQRRNGTLKLLMPPPAYVLGAAQEQAVSRLSQSASALQDSYRAFLAASALAGTEADTEIRKLQSQIAQQQARLDSFITDDSGATLAPARPDLDRAQVAESKAAADFAGNYATLISLHQLVIASADHELADRIQQKQQEIQELRSALASSPTIGKPDEASVAVAPTPDLRVQYLVAGVVGVLLLFAGPLWMSVSPSNSQIPYASPMVEGYEVPGRPLTLPAPDPFDEEHPATA